ncbi:sn-glycerol-1-phosphate dehydrogenase [Marinicrinis lubricantis]|uniref:Sn-glycerol-1-phosphate dehydrogenase n=1 Tax=Marinicrinis lubricantis TaxID=2086470 RepID=A0ABW1IL05_9BACL
MKSKIDRMNGGSSVCQCGHPHHTVEMECVIGRGVLVQVSTYLNENNYSKPHIIADDHTFKAAGERLKEQLEGHDIPCSVTRLKPNAAGDVLADGDSILQLLSELIPDVQLLIAVGSGTIHDIVRFVSYKTGIPFISVPTAASVDGFTSAGAPLIIHQFKQTIQAVPPKAIFADTEILVKAPKALTAAGFGDMLGKFTSLADWIISREMGQEPFCPLAYEWTKEALDACVEYAEEIASGSEKGIQILMESLILSGLSMLMIDHSRPASGGEHHISHMWEMDFILNGRKQLLHGAKVGVATILLTPLYHRLASEKPGSAFEVYASIPEAEQIASWMRAAGGPTTPEELGISEELVTDALLRAPDIRQRYTGLKYIRDHMPIWLKKR